MAVVYGALALLLVVAVVAVAYGSQSPGVRVAEFASAAQQSVEAPPTTNSASAAAGERGRRLSTTTTAAAAATTGPPSADPQSTVAKATRARTCVGSPPRQIDDPQSPPCAATIFEGDNGGATSTGVSGTEIAVAVPGVSAGPTQDAAEALFDYFNQRFEFYGRRLRPIFVPRPAGNDPAANRALASDLAARQVFAVLPGVLERSSSALPSLYQELARQGVVSVANNFGQGLSDVVTFDELHPYVWSVYPSIEQVARNLTDFVCTSLAGRPARHAGTVALRSQTRALGIVVTGRHVVPPSRPLREGLAACGVVPVIVNWDSGRDTTTQLATAMQFLKSSGVTTVACVCFASGLYSVMPQAVSVDYHPEWIFSMETVGSEEQGGQLMPASERVHTMALMERPKLLPIQARPWFQAMQAVRPHVVAPVGQSGGLYEILAFGSRGYGQLLVLAAGIQAAGPNLTPATFATGLMSTQFPNPGAGAAPFWQPSVGFGPGDHSFTNDYAVAWWNEAADALDAVALGQSAKGTWCYIDQGARHSAGGFAATIDDRLFGLDEPCH